MKSDCDKLVVILTTIVILSVIQIKAGSSCKCTFREYNTMEHRFNNVRFSD